MGFNYGGQVGMRHGSLMRWLGKRLKETLWRSFWDDVYEWLYGGLWHCAGRLRNFGIMRGILESRDPRAR